LLGQRQVQRPPFIVTAPGARGSFLGETSVSQPGKRIEPADGIRILRAALALPTRSGWREPAVRRGRFGSAKNAGHCKCVIEPRRAYARRPCRRSFPHRKCRCFSAGRKSSTKSGWREPAVDYQTRCRALPNHGGLTPAAPANVRVHITTSVCCIKRPFVHQERLA